jgi:hypothetical protein
VGLQLVDVETVSAAWASSGMSVGRTFNRIQGTPHQKRLCALHDKWMSDCISQSASYVNFESNFNTEHLKDLLRLRVGGQ